MKTLNTLKAKIFIVALIASAFTFQSNAQTCATTLTSKTGKVYSVNPANITTKATSDKVTIRIKKTAGKAETQVNIYVNNVMQQNKTIEFDNGKYTTGYRTATLNNVKNKNIKVKVVNQSVGNTFSYKLKIDGASSSLASTGGKVVGSLVGQTNKTIYTNNSCTNKARIVVRRNSGKARGNIRVWEKNGSSWSLLNQYNQTLEKSESQKVFTVNSNKPLKVELRNVSIGNNLGYTMNALAAN
ncbi:hypothetical protein [Ulvibacter litoralis]|uniref:Uncharacterized protein n=1 Tax=Ulvibacter litoralis TaxID=227084 RepID=A0A1G7BV17_9FLAO|nr:hypothetical protein [Ulvibacter litoralis]GHC49640.1 hypothetical protein GCM10008083_11500 [Ulvibacter litoralis]SDE30971.1 hypothetical protein SAMN05421855_10136 [Ulvibacter litoralis]